MTAREKEIREHELKCWPQFFGDVESGRKTFELRKNDRDYQPGDTLRLREWDPATKDYTGRECRVPVSHVLNDVDGHAFGLQEGYAILSIQNPLARSEERKRTIEEIGGQLRKKRIQISDYIAEIDPTTGDHRRHALTIAEGRLLQIDMDLAAIRSLPISE